VHTNPALDPNTHGGVLPLRAVQSNAVVRLEVLLFRGDPGASDPRSEVYLTGLIRWSEHLRAEGMPRYYFNLRDGTAGVSDPDGTSLPDDAAASEHAVQVARELMRQAEVKRRYWQLDVCDERGKALFNLPFAGVDRTIDHLRPRTRQLLEDLWQNQRKLAEAVFEARLLVLSSRATLARSKGKLYLVARYGRRI